MSGKKSLAEIESKTKMVQRLADSNKTGLYAVEDAVTVAEPWDSEAVQAVRDRAKTFEEQGAIPGAGYTMDDRAVGVYELMQELIVVEGGSPKGGSGASHGCYARTAYEQNLAELTDLIGGVDDIDLTEEEK